MNTKTKILTVVDPEFGPIHFEIDEALESKYGDASSTGGKFQKVVEGRIGKLLESLLNFGRGVLATVKSLQPSEVEIKSGIKIEIQEGELIGLLAKAKSEFPFEVTLRWKLDEQKNPDKGSEG